MLEKEAVTADTEILVNKAESIDEVVVEDTDISTDETVLEENISVDESEGEGVGEATDYSVDEGMYMDGGFEEGMYMDPGMEMGMVEVKDPLLSSWPFVLGISAAVLVVSIVVGVLLAKLRIKKGIDLYED